MKQTQSKEDMDFFFKLGFETLKTLRKSVYDKLVEDNPGKSEDEMFEIYRKENEEYFDFSAPTARVFIAEQDDGKRCGYLWMGMRKSQDSWDIQTPLWIYDIVVTPESQGNGLGRQLMKKAEEFAFELNHNIGLFVHSDNESAIALYEKTGYRMKIVPISKRVDQDYSVPPINSKFLIRKEEKADRNSVRMVGLQRFRRRVLFSQDIENEIIEKRYEDYLSKYNNDSKMHLRLVAFTDNEKLVGSAWVGVSGFSEKVVMIYELSIVTQNGTDDLGEALVYSIEKWAKNSGYSTVYILLHSEDDMSLEAFRTMNYTIPGFFMERRIIQ